MYANDTTARKMVKGAITRALKQVPGATEKDVPFYYVREQDLRVWQMKAGHPTRYYMAVDNPHDSNGRKVMFKTKKDLDNKFDLKAIQERMVQLIKDQRSVNRHRDEMRRNRNANADLSKRIAKDVNMWDHYVGVSEHSRGGIRMTQPNTVVVTDENYDDVVAWIKQGQALGFFNSNDED